MDMSDESSKQPQELGILDIITYIRIDDKIYAHNELEILYEAFKQKEGKN